MRILIVDDSDAVRTSLKEMVEQAVSECTIEEAASTDEAFDALRETTPDVMILDIRLPDGSGIHVLQYVRDKELPIKVIVLTNYPYAQYQRRCMKMGADYFFDKSAEFEKVGEVLRVEERGLRNAEAGEIES